MKHARRHTSAGGEKDALLSNVALLYYGEGLTQGEIARRFKISRATVVNMLRECREKGIVEIQVDGALLAGSSLSRDLCARFGLEDVYVASIEAPPAKNGRKENLPLVARVAAMAALDIVEPGDRIGVAWGETIAAMAKAMPRAPMSDIEVCQLIGSKDSDRVPASEICAIEVANKLGANCFTLHAPGIVSSVELAEAFRSEPTIKTQLARLADLDLTIASVGNVADDTHLATAGMATPEALRAARQAGSVGIYCCRYIDENGNDMPLEPQNRIIAASIENLKAARKRLLVVCGADRLQATHAAIKGGLVTHLVVDQTLATALLAL
nr:sugar-binding domain-containing protein [Marinicella sp. W31]MDC2879980.1 sugar-binding domain-containing protein [Marinicella sp. W31]